MRSKVRYILLLLITILLFAVFTSCNITKRQITIAIIQGEPEILKKGESEWITISKGMLVNPGDYLRTGVNEYIWMEINDGSYLGLGKETEAGLTTLSKAFTDPVTEIDLKDGMVFVIVTKELGAGHFEVYTPLITVGVVGSKMAVDYDKTKSTADIACLEGTVTGEYGDDTASPQVDSGYILGVSVGTIKDGFNSSIYKARPADEVYNEFNYFDSRYRNPLWGTEEAMFTQEKIRETNRVATVHMLDTIRAFTPTLFEMETLTPTVQATETPTPDRLLRPTITVNPSAPLTSEEENNQGIHDYVLISNTCATSISQNIKEVMIEFKGNMLVISNNQNRSEYYKVADNTWQAVAGTDVVVIVLTEKGFNSEASCGTWVYERK